MSSDIVRRLLLDSHRPGLAGVSREWRAQYAALADNAKAPGSQKEILAACRAGNWPGVMKLRPRADYFFCWHTRCMVHIHCTFEMICFYEMVFCGVGRHGVIESLQIAPGYMLLNKDTSVWERSGPHVWRDEYDIYKEALAEDYDSHNTSYTVENLMVMMGKVSGIEARSYWDYDFLATKDTVSHNWMKVTWISSVKRGFFDTADLAWSKKQSCITSPEDIDNVHKVINQGYLEGIDYLISRGLSVEKVCLIALQNEKHGVALYYTAPDKMVPPLCSGSTGREQIVRHAQKRVYRRLL
jgi:hypothetical protein